MACTIELLISGHVVRFTYICDILWNATPYTSQQQQLGKLYGKTSKQ